MSDILIQIEGLKLQINHVKLTESISLSLNKDFRLGITGPSGCGKSTLIKSLIKNKFPENSSVSKFQFNQKVRSAYVPQKNGLLSWFSLRKHFEVFSKNNELNQLVASEFNLDKSLDNFPHQLSGGEYQRATLANAIMSEPELYLADEPLTELDIVSKLKLLTYWSEVISNTSASLLLISHDIETLAYLCDRVIVLTDKPSVIKKDFTLNAPHPRTKEFLVSQEFNDAKKELLEIIKTK